MRKIVTSKDLSKAELAEVERKAKQDDYLTRLIKYIPSETVTLYVTLYGMASGAIAEIPFEQITWLIFVVGVVLTPLYLWRIANVNDWLQISVATVAFVIWVFALGGPFANLSWYHSVYGALLLPTFTAVIPLFER